MRDRSVVRLSVTPSTKYSCSATPVMFAKGRTTMERRGGPCLFCAEAGAPAVRPCEPGLIG